MCILWYLWSRLIHKLLQKPRISPRIEKSLYLWKCSCLLLCTAEPADSAENTHLLRKGKYHCTADLLFDQLGFGQTSKSVHSFNSTKPMNTNQSNRRSVVSFSDISPYLKKWVFSDVCYHLHKSNFTKVERVGPTKMTSYAIVPVVSLESLPKFSALHVSHRRPKKKTWPACLPLLTGVFMLPTCH